MIGTEADETACPRVIKPTLLGLSVMVRAGSVVEAAVNDPLTAAGVPPGPEEIATIEVTAVETATVIVL